MLLLLLSQLVFWYACPDIDLIVNNARVGTMISVELSKLERLEGRDQSSGTPSDVIRKRAATSVAKQPVRNTSL